MAGLIALGLSGAGLFAVLAHGPFALELAGSALGSAELPPLAHEWRLIGGKHWQIVSAAVESRAQTDVVEGNRGACSEGMIEVAGDMKLDPSTTAYYDQNSVEELQKRACVQWINRDYPERCAVYDRKKWLELSKELAVKSMHFCMDRFEYPNQKGQYPMVMVSFPEAAEVCASEGKRLCDEAEWTFACEGEEATPYPYGYTRDPQACVVDLQWKPFNERALYPRDGLAARAELDKLWQGLPSGARPTCRSPFGVYDLAGNVDEWSRSVRPNGRRSILKGGYWGPVRTRCRPSTRSHEESHTFYQQGFRCCGDVGATAAASIDASSPTTPASVASDAGASTRAFVP
jgi:hypothetical protein